MNSSQKLHAYARQVCIDRFRHWASAYEPIAEEQSQRFRLVYTDEAYRIFPRYNVDKAVLRAVEKLDSQNLPPFEALKQHLTHTAQTAASPFTESINNEVHDAAMALEREWLSHHFLQLTPNDIEGQQPLPYRRVLNDTELAELRARLKDRWGLADGYWYPLSDKTHPSLIAYHLADVDEPALQDLIRDYLRRQGISRIYELRESGDGYELDLGAEDLFYDGDEGVWTDRGVNWIAYCSHESTLTFGGGLAEYLTKQMPPASD